MSEAVSVQSLTIKLSGGSSQLLDDESHIEAGLAALVRAAGLHPLEAVSHRFMPQGISTALLLEESHIAIHTWPERGVAYLTLSTCRPLPSTQRQHLTMAAQELFLAEQAVAEEVLL